MSSSKDLTTLLVKWRRLHAPELADAISSHARAMESDVALDVRQRGKIPQAEWLGAAKKATVVDRGAFIDTFSECSLNKAKERFEIIASWDDDPRVSGLIHRMIETLPWVSHPAKALWRRAVERLEAIDDPRSREVIEAFDPSQIRSGSRAFAEYLKRMLDRALANMSNQASTLSAADRAKLDKLAAWKPATPTGDPYELLRQDPLEESIQVIADRLIENGDPRGRLILLQRSETELTRAEKSEVKKILKANHDELLGPLGGLLKKKNLVFRNGFVAEAEAKDVVQAAAIKKAIASPLVTTIVALSGNGDVAINSELSRLETVRDIDMSSLANATAPLPWKRLHAWYADYHGDVLNRTDLLPKLEELWLYHTAFESDQMLEEVLESKLVRQVKRFIVDVENAREVGELLIASHKHLKGGRSHSARWELRHFALRSEITVTLQRRGKATNANFQVALGSDESEHKKSAVQGLMACAKAVKGLKLSAVDLTMTGATGETDKRQTKTLERLRKALG